jgi:hypothetical protein
VTWGLGGGGLHYACVLPAGGKALQRYDSIVPFTSIVARIADDGANFREINCSVQFSPVIYGIFT